MNMKKVLLTIAVCCLAAAIPTANAGDATDACMDGPMAQFGRYVGDSKITDEALARDGSAWGPGKGARWTFVWR